MSINQRYYFSMSLFTVSPMEWTTLAIITMVLNLVVVAIPAILSQLWTPTWLGLFITLKMGPDMDLAYLLVAMLVLMAKWMDCMVLSTNAVIWIGNVCSPSVLPKHILISLPSQPICRHSYWRSSRRDPCPMQRSTWVSIPAKKTGRRRCRTPWHDF